jgi:hypothetical protein
MVSPSRHIALHICGGSSTTCCSTRP